VARFCHRPPRYTEFVNRLLILVAALLLGLAAPARAWCEASCPVASSEAATPHCPVTEPADDGPAITGSEIADCPAVESARPAIMKIEFAAAPATAVWHLAPTHLSTPAPRHPGTQAPRHPVTIPLRI
jgi:hypothetical protein